VDDEPDDAPLQFDCHNNFSGVAALFPALRPCSRLPCLGVAANQVAAWKFSKNQEINTLHVKDARRWAEHTQWRVVKGDTLLFDFIFFTHATAIGHWWEMMGPLYSVLKQVRSSRGQPTCLLQPSTLSRVRHCCCRCNF